MVGRQQGTLFFFLRIQLPHLTFWPHCIALIGDHRQDAALKIILYLTIKQSFVIIKMCCGYRKDAKSPSPIKGLPAQRELAALVGIVKSTDSDKSLLAASSFAFKA